MTESADVDVIFLVPSAPYVVGEQARFPRAQAVSLVATGAARFADNPSALAEPLAGKRTGQTTRYARR